MIVLQTLYGKVSLAIATCVHVDVLMVVSVQLFKRIFANVFQVVGVLRQDLKISHPCNLPTP